jgi:hypothetical protein
MMIDDGDFWQPAPTGSQRAVGGTPPRAGSGRSGSGRGRMLAATLAVLVVIGLGAAGAYALNHDNGSVGAATTPTTTKAKAKTTTKAAAVVATTPATNAATSSSSNGGETVPEDEQCSAAIKANTRWVCLTSATFDEGALTINYKSNFAGVAPNAHGGYHLNIYGGNGVTPADNIEGRQSMTPGHWYVEDQNPSIVKATSDEYKTAIGSAPKVCARIADSNDMLVPDKNGTFVTGNCVTIRKI